MYGMWMNMQGKGLQKCQCIHVHLEGLVVWDIWKIANWYEVCCVLLIPHQLFSDLPLYSLTCITNTFYDIYSLLLSSLDYFMDSRPCYINPQDTQYISQLNLSRNTYHICYFPCFYKSLTYSEGLLALYLKLLTLAKKSLCKSWSQEVLCAMNLWPY